MGVSGSGEIVQLQAMRCLDLVNQSLAEHLTERCSEYKPPYLDADPLTARWDLARISNKITGRVVCRGEFWLAQSVRGAD